MICTFKWLYPYIPPLTPTQGTIGVWAVITQKPGRRDEYHRPKEEAAGTELLSKSGRPVPGCCQICHRLGKIELEASCLQ